MSLVQMFKENVISTDVQGVVSLHGLLNLFFFCFSKSGFIKKCH